MKTLNTREVVRVPSGVTVTAKGRRIVVTGPRGTLERNFQHAQLDIFVEQPNEEHTVPTVVVQRFHGNRKDNSLVRTIASHIHNLIVGVTKGYRYKMRFVYAHFPVNCKIADNKKSIEIRNFLGEKRVRRVEMGEGVTVEATGQKDEIQIQGNDLETVSKCSAAIHLATLVRDKDIRKFLDGIYVSEKGFIEEDVELVY
ncbi:hypothetical protein ABK040_000071 [Willaertia magna]